MLYLPDPNFFLYMYIRNEAVLSSQIEGTQSTLSDLLLFEHEGTPSVPLADVVEVSAYVRALNHGVARLAELPLSMRLLGEVHRELLTGTRGGDKSPGAIRVTQNWIGGSMPGNAHYVPPPPHLLGELLSNLEKFLNDEPARTRPLLKAGLTHAQFETIHPFLDGNGRLGRLLITLLLVSEKMLGSPLLYLSLHFKEHKDEYYERLQRVRTHGEWLPWLEFFFAGVESVSQRASDNVVALMALFRQHEQAIVDRGGRGVSTMLRVFKIAKNEAVVAIPTAVKRLGLTHPSVSAAVKALVELGILVEVTGKARDRRYLYKDYVTQLSKGLK
ncbi:Fic family protein [soil metagenome]